MPHPPRVRSPPSKRRSQKFQSQEILFSWVKTVKVTLNRLFSFFLCPNSDSLFDFGNEYLTVADLSGFRRLHDRRDSIIQLCIADHHFEFDLRQKIHGVFTPAIDFSVSLLAAEPFDLADSHSFDSHLSEGVFDFF